jgi:hypothetical protein
MVCDTSIVNGDLIGQIGFAASNDSDGGDAIAICSTISVKAEGTFDASNNPGAIVFATAPSNGPTDRLKVTNEGHFVPLADITYDLGVSGSLSFRDACVSGIVFADGTYQTTAATAGGGGTPGGNSTEFQFNDGGSFNGTTGVVYEATDGTGILLKVHGTGDPKENLFTVEYTGLTTETTVSIYRNNDTDTANLFQVKTETEDIDLFSVSATGKVYERSSYSNVVHTGHGTTFTFDLDESNIFTATVNSTAATVDVKNSDVGQRFILRLNNGVAGARVTNWFSNINWPGGQPASGSIINGETNLFGFLAYSGAGATVYYDGFAIATGVT